ncbi:MAG: polysaccharide deacetylase family protein [Pseudomonadota bacterium]
MIVKLVPILGCLLVLGCEAPISEKPLDRKQIALTYDDAPLGDGPRYIGVERTDALIRQLDEAASGPVAIFVTTKGFELQQGSERIAAYADAGHYIANHSDQHMWGSRTPTADYIADIDRAETKLAMFDNRRPWFRFPFLDEGGQGDANKSGEKRDAYRTALAERGLISGYVTVDTYDWHLDSLWSQAVRDGRAIDMDALSKVYVDMVVDAANHYDQLSQRVLDRRPIQVLLLHENDLAATFTVDMIEALRADGWEITDPDLALADPIVNQMPATLHSGGGRISALAMDSGLRDWATLSHWGVNQTEITRRAFETGAIEAPADLETTE